MNILALDGSGVTASVAVLSDEKILAEYSVNYKKTHSETLLPMIQEVLDMVEIKPAELDYIAVSNGPGSFTGLRICSGTAKGLGFALDIPMVKVGSIEGLAYNLQGEERLICPIMDARRGQVYTGLYSFENDELKVLMDQCAISIDELIEAVNNEGKAVVFLGDGVPVFKKIILEKSSVPVSFAAAGNSLQRASSVGIRALSLISEGKVCSAMELVPDYYRLSQAERERMEREQNAD